MAAARSSRRGFTLVEMLVVLAVVAILSALLYPALGTATEHGRRGACLSNLRQIGAALAAYAADEDGRIPCGPKAPPFTSPSNLYPSTGAPTSLLSLRGGTPVGLGLLLERHLANTPRVLFCPGADATTDAAAELAKVGTSQAQCSYFYRHAGNTQLFDSPGTKVPDIRLHSLGDNRNGKPIRALVIDALFVCPPDLGNFGVISRTNHRSKMANILFADGHVASRENRDGRFTVDVTDYSQLRQSFDKILRVFERADAEP